MKQILTRPTGLLRKRLFAVLAVTVYGLSLQASVAAAANFNPRETSVQMFRWKWNDIAKECTNFLGPKGYGAVQISPPQASASLNAWYDIYQPVNFTQLNSNMGTETELKSMITTCHTAKVRVFADVVVNHMAAGSGTATDGTTWNSTTLAYPFFSASDFHPNCTIQDSDYSNNRNNVMQCRLVGLPDLATEGTYVRGQVKNYLNKLIAMGIDGFRFDAAKHMNPADLKAFVSSVSSTSTSGEALWITQEIISDGTVNRADYLPAGTINEFKFAAAMRETFRSTNGNQLAQIRTYMGSPGAWGGSWGFLDSSQASVFVNNWDTERNGDSMNASNYTGVVNDSQGSKRYDLANIFMLAWPYGHAQIHSGFRFTNKDQNSPAASPFDSSGNPKINIDWDFIHRWSDIADMVALRNTAAGEGVSNFVSGTSNQIAFGRGSKAFVAINNEFSVWNASFQTSLPAGTYCNVVHGLRNPTTDTCLSDSVTVASNGVFSVAIPANGGATVPAIALHTNQKLGGTVPPTCTTVPVKFRVANANTTMGQNVYVVGNRAELSNWTPTTSMTIEGSGANVPWSITVQLPPSTAIQYKFMKHGAVADVWESNQATASGNREVMTQACGAANLVLDAGNFKF